MSLVGRGEIDLVTLISRLTYQTAQIIRYSGLTGSLKIGSPADITIFDPDARWTVEIVARIAIMKENLTISKPIQRNLTPLSNLQRRILTLLDFDPHIYTKLAAHSWAPA